MLREANAVRRRGTRLGGLQLGAHSLPAPAPAAAPPAPVSCSGVCLLLADGAEGESGSSDAGHQQRQQLLRRRQLQEQRAWEADVGLALSASALRKQVFRVPAPRGGGVLTEPGAASCLGSSQQLPHQLPHPLPHTPPATALLCLPGSPPSAHAYLLDPGQASQQQQEQEGRQGDKPAVMQQAADLAGLQQGAKEGPCFQEARGQSVQCDHDGLHNHDGQQGCEVLHWHERQQSGNALHDRDALHDARPDPQHLRHDAHAGHGGQHRPLPAPQHLGLVAASSVSELCRKRAPPQPPPQSGAPRKRRCNEYAQQQRMLQDALAALSSVDTRAGASTVAGQRDGAPLLHAGAGGVAASLPLPHLLAEQQQRQQRQLDVRPAIHLKEPGLLAHPTTAAALPPPPAASLCSVCPPAATTTQCGPPRATATAVAAAAGAAAGSRQRSNGVGGDGGVGGACSARASRGDVKGVACGLAASTRASAPPTPPGADTAESESLAPAGTAARFPPAGEWKALYGAAGGWRAG